MRNHIELDCEADEATISYSALKNTGCDDFAIETDFKFKFVLFRNEQELLGENDTATDFISQINSSCVLHEGTTNDKLDFNKKVKYEDCFRMTPSRHELTTFLYFYLNTDPNDNLAWTNPGKSP